MAVHFRLAVVGLVHDHIWGTLDHLREDPRAELVAVVDDHEELRQRVVSEYGVPASNSFATLEALLAAVNVDAIVCGSENNRHAPIVAAASARGIHVMVEKPMAATLAQARQMASDVTSSNIILMINWPTAWDRGIRHAHTLVQQGAIGTPFYIKYHAGHNGPREIGCSTYFWSWLYDEEKNGPGALMDYCCYGANLACLFLGLPQSVSGAGGRFIKDYDIPLDNSVLLMQYPHAVGIAEASWTQIGHPPHYELTVMGSTGSIVAPFGSDHIIVVTPDHPAGQQVAVPELPVGQNNEATYFLTLLEQGQQPAGMVSPQVCLAAQEVLEAGASAIKESRVVSLPLPSKG